MCTSCWTAGALTSPFSSFQTDFIIALWLLAKLWFLVSLKCCQEKKVVSSTIDSPFSSTALAMLQDEFTTQGVSCDSRCHKEAHRHTVPAGARTGTYL